MSFLEQLKENVQLIAILGTFISVLLAVIRYYVATKREQAAREYETYNALDERYMEFQKLCMQYPHLDVFDIADAKTAALTDVQRKQELILFTMLISLFERAYLMYYGQSQALKRRQWRGWEAYIHAYGQRPNFRAAWDTIAAPDAASDETSFDQKFTKFMTAALSGT